MIRIRKGAEPKILANEGRAETRRMMEQYDTDPESYHCGKSKFSFDDQIYKAPEVRSVLETDQHSKCCYTEARLQQYPHVEHFRPKGRVSSRVTTEKLRPGYYWLAYCWSNLMLSNAKVNVSYKMDYFPLRIEDDRARSHHDEESDESPTLIDPCSEDPRDHIRFHLDEPKSISERGKISIIVFGLRDPRLQDDRMRHLGYLGVFKDIIAAYENSADDRKTSALTESIERAKQILIEAVTPSAPFSSMAIDFLDR